MAKRNTMNADEIKKTNTKLIEVLDKIANSISMSRGNDFDESIKLAFIGLMKAKLITTKEWGSKYQHLKKITTKDIYDLTPRKDEPNEHDLNMDQIYLIDKPNGSQRWPDLLLVVNGVGLPIEIKTSQDDRILWNSTLPQEGSLYIYNCPSKGMKTTFFLGQHILSAETAKHMHIQWEATKIMQESMNSDWSFYSRKNFMNRRPLFESNDDDKEGIAKRQNTEKETRRFLKTLSWNPVKQKTDFNMEEVTPEEVNLYINQRISAHLYSMVINGNKKSADKKTSSKP